MVQDRFPGLILLSKETLFSGAGLILQKTFTSLERDLTNGTLCWEAIHFSRKTHFSRDNFFSGGDTFFGGGTFFKEEGEKFFWETLFLKKNFPTGRSFFPRGDTFFKGDTFYEIPDFLGKALFLEETILSRETLCTERYNFR